MENRPDLFLDIPMQQPKREIAEYVAANDLPVPDIYPSVEDALKARETVLIRSEHPADYNGLSGVIDSWQLKEIEKLDLQIDVDLDEMASSECDIERLQFLDWVKRAKKGLTLELERELAEMSVRRSLSSSHSLVNVEEILNETTFSGWEFVPGENVTVAADSSVRGRYHIFSNGKTSRYCTWEIHEGGPLASLVRAYEKVRALEMFNPEHAYLMEFQTGKDGEHLFLQAHRTRDVAHPEFTLDDRTIPQDAFAATWVRGHTGPDGIRVNLSLYNFGGIGRLEKSALSQGNKAAVYTQGASPLFEELEARGRVLQVMTADSPSDVLAGSSHGSPSMITKPELTLATATHVDWIKTFKEKLGETAFEKITEGEVLHVPVHVVSDGTRAFIRVEN